jgi:hypothetical protein
MLDVAKAVKELASKDMLTIERDTALAWGGRAAASYSCVMDEDDPRAQQRCFWEGENYRQEALEHAAMTEDLHFVADILKEIDGYRAKAKKVLERTVDRKQGAKKRPLRNRPVRAT